MAVSKLFKDEATEEKGERARMASFIGAMAIADLVKTTLGPKGMDKILQSTGRGRSVTVTNDGATILKSLHIDNPAAKVLVDISKVQDDEVGDGTTSVVVLAGELLREAEKLVATNIHPMTIISGLFKILTIFSRGFTFVSKELFHLYFEFQIQLTVTFKGWQSLVASEWQKVTSYALGLLIVSGDGVEIVVGGGGWWGWRGGTEQVVQGTEYDRLHLLFGGGHQRLRRNAVHRWQEVGGRTATKIVDVVVMDSGGGGDGDIVLCCSLKLGLLLKFLFFMWMPIWFGYEWFSPILLLDCRTHVAEFTLFKKVIRIQFSSSLMHLVDCGSTNLESIQIIKKPGGSLKDSFLDEGFILDKKIGIGQPKRIENAKILVANTAMDTDKVKIYGARVRVDSMSRVAEIEGAEKEKMREKVQKIIAHGINCFVNRQLIYNFPEELFADAGILAIEHADFDGIERLALVTGGEIASTFDNPESVKLGHCKLIEEIMIGEDKLIHFSGVEMGQACTIVLRGASFHVLDEAERSLHDALCVLSQTVNDSRVLLGGGWPEMVMAKAVDELAWKTPGKKSHAIEAFSRALVAIPTTIADNAGLDSAELIAQLRAEHHKEGSTVGIDVISGSVGDMSELGISESFKVKQAVLLSATEAAEMILRVDEIITCAPRHRENRM
ncbi:T-complex protein 1 subunit beta-like [Cornus florida]|uniref:T-complex protein 1 subunit beta-like n=1 Tax=Cornus florida TaxID=4283 RepID=UPI00289EA636|nr:T-complex protein 1 subunit beta-like [Cornus florida]